MSSTTYTQTPWQQWVQQIVSPYIASIYDRGRISSNQSLWDIPYLSDYVKPASSYAPGSESYQNLYDVLAPSITDTYTKQYIEPTYAKLANAGTLGSNYGGVSGAAAQVLSDEYAKIPDKINTAVLSAYEPYGTNQQTADQSALEKWYDAYMNQQEYPAQAAQTVGFESDQQPVVTSDSGGSGK